MKNHVHHATGKIFPRGWKKRHRSHFIRALRERPFKHAATIPAYAGNFPAQLFMFGNGPDSNWPNPDGDGNCVSAGEAVNKTCAGILISDATLYKWCVANGTLNGADLQPVIQQMQTAGFTQDGNVYGDGLPLAVDYTDLPTLQAAIYTAVSNGGGTVKCGVAADELPSGAGNNNGWFMLTDSPDSNEDHDMEALGYGTLAQCVQMLNQAYPGLNLAVPTGVDPTTPCIIMDTWGTLGIVAYTAFCNFVAEAWARNPSTTITGTGTPAKIAVTVINGGTPTPVPPGPTPIPPSPPVPPTPVSSGYVVIPDQVIMVPHGFGHVPVTVKGGTYPVSGTLQNLVLPPNVVQLLLAACAFAKANPINSFEAMIVSYLCALLPPAQPSSQAAAIVIPPWIMAAIQFLCPFAAFLPAPYGPAIVAICAVINPPTAKCGCS